MNVPQPSAKYPRTLHLPWSDTIGPDGDHVLESTRELENQEVVVTEKLDGENTTLYRSHLHARSLDSGHHPSRGWIKNYHARLAPHIPDGVRLSGESLFAFHSIPYDALPSYFLVYGVWRADELLSWDDTTRLCDEIERHSGFRLFRSGFAASGTRKRFARSIRAHRSSGQRAKAASCDWRVRSGVTSGTKASPNMCGLVTFKPGRIGC